MATKKKTETQINDQETKTFTLTKQQFDSLKDVAYRIMTVRSSLEDLKGEDSVSDIMFEVGVATNNAQWCETFLDEIVDSFAEQDTED